MPPCAASEPWPVGVGLFLVTCPSALALSVPRVLLETLGAHCPGVSLWWRRGVTRVQKQGSGGRAACPSVSTGSARSMARLRFGLSWDGPSPPGVREPGTSVGPLELNCHFASMLASRAVQSSTGVGTWCSEFRSQLGHPQFLPAK